MRRFFFVVLAVALFSTALFADTIPSFNLNSGTISYAFVAPGLPSNTDYFFSGPNGVSVNGFNASIPVCSFVLAGDTCTPQVVTQNDFDSRASATFGGQSYAPLFTTGGIVVSGSAFTLPGFTGPQPIDATLNLTIPVIFSGTLGVCPLDVVGCIAPPGITNPNIALFNVNGTGIGQLQFTLISNINDPTSIWTLTSASYTMNSVSPVPEPASITLFGTGALGLFGRFLRRRRRQRVS